MKAYSINLEEHIRRYDLQRDRMARIGVSLDRFPAVRYDPAVHGKDVSPVCRRVCPKTPIGIFLSHRGVARALLRTDPAPYALVMEDDAYPLDGTTAEAIRDVAERAAPGWDVIRLHCIGLCNVKYMNGSAAAYLISKAGQAKMANKVVAMPAHVDMMQNIYADFDVRIGPKMFATDESDSTNRTSPRRVSAFDRLIDVVVPVHGEVHTHNMLEFPKARVGSAIVTYRDSIALIGAAVVARLYGCRYAAAFLAFMLLRVFPERPAKTSLCPDNE